MIELLVSKKNAKLSDHMAKAEYKVKGGKLIRIQLSKIDNKIDRIRITGDFFIHPEDFIEDLEKGLSGCSLNETKLASSIVNLTNTKKAVMLGVSPEDFAKCIMLAGEKND